MAETTDNTHYDTTSYAGSDQVPDGVDTRGRQGVSIVTSRENVSTIVATNGGLLTETRVDAGHVDQGSVAGWAGELPCPSPAEIPDIPLMEKMWLWRRRQGWSIVKCGQKLGVSKHTVVKWEDGRKEPHLYVATNVMEQLTPTPAEYMRLLRRRSGYDSRKVGELNGWSHVYTLMLERRADPELREWYEEEWEARRLYEEEHGANSWLTTPD